MLLTVPTLGERLQTIRRQIAPRFTQGDLAEAMGVAQSAVSKWETDETRPDAVQLIAIAAALGCSVEDLVVGVDRSYDRLRSKRRDLPDHANQGSLPAAHSQSQQGVRDVTGEAQSRVLKELADAHDTFVRAVSDVARRLARIVEDEKAHGALGASRKPKADGLRGSRKVG